MMTTRETTPVSNSAKAFMALLSVGMIGFIVNGLGEWFDFMPMVIGGLIVSWLAGAGSMLAVVGLLFQKPNEPGPDSHDKTKRLQEPDTPNGK